MYLPTTGDSERRTQRDKEIKGALKGKETAKIQYNNEIQKSDESEALINQGLKLPTEASTGFI